MRWLKPWVLTLVLLAGQTAFAAYQINAVKVTGNHEATVLFAVTGGEGAVPQMRVTDNIAELTFSGADLAESLADKVELVAPHALLDRVSAYVPEPHVVRARIAINGSLENLKGRLSVVKVPGGIQLVVNYPKGGNATLDLLKEEQEPIAKINGEKTVKAPALGATQIILIVVMLVMAAGACFFFARFMQRKTGIKGTRKYLVEQLSYCPLGPKVGVSLLKVGSDFVLVGVTPSQVNMLSNLPKLQAQYEEDSSFERTNFKQAVKEEFDRIKTPATL